MPLLFANFQRQVFSRRGEFNNNAVNQVRLHIAVLLSTCHPKVTLTKYFVTLVTLNNNVTSHLS